MKATLWKVGMAHAEAAVYEGEYRGTMIRLVRTTDFNVWTGRNRLGEKDATDAWWDGYVATGMNGLDVRFDVFAEHRGTRREALHDLTRHIDRMLDR